MISPVDVKSEKLFVVAVLGLCVNMVGMFAFDHGLMHGGNHHDCHSHDHHSHHNHSHHDHDHSHSHSHSKTPVNPIFQGMYLHVLADTLGSVSVVISSILIYFFGWTWSDPICSLGISVMILLSTWPLLKGTAFVLLQRTPFDVQGRLNEALRQVTEIDGVEMYYAPHIWELAHEEYVGTIKLVCSPSAAFGDVLRFTQTVFQGIGVRNMTIQIEVDPHHLQSSTYHSMAHSKYSIYSN